MACWARNNWPRRRPSGNRPGRKTDQAMQHINGIAPHIIIIGMPQFIIFIIMSKHILSISMVMPSFGIIMQVMP